MSLIERLKEAQKDAMRAKDKIRLGTIRMALAEVKQKEVDTREAVSESDAIAILTKMLKQRKDAHAQFEAAGRQDLADQEAAEMVVLQDFLPQALTETELEALIGQAMQETGAAGMQDMGKVMAWLKPQVQGRTDMGQLSGKIKAKLG
ncbi:GatB/YqeY domain-containing protein [Bowmanella yangjiangensis]|uniref:GatB/YqeY domain-containing protein n=1 Tax=Bowmanella yangjiangensis TaxID=2811230 RepID=A0ABS3CT88_9ALTE|nr:GatB/YqeY domain-containing protein [Bowmanella yangjiangensis]MBN7820326.1 GatB/YqeY domain-containing protein [Bowmanella yangjiangensis]